MILYSWRGLSSNFGDELNTVLWPRLLPGFFDEDPAIRFLGIGSVLDRRHSSAGIKLVAGSGYGGYEPKPMLDRSWHIHWVRGPRTAAMLGLPASLALGDPAVLVGPALGPPKTAGSEIGFMPHFESAARGTWREVAERAGVRLIDPRAPPLNILRAIGECKLLLSEALHGIIVADALRVPWVAIRPLARIHRAKWSDWADTVKVRPRFQALPPSTLSEWASNSHLGSWHTTRTWLDRYEPCLDRVTSERLIARASQALRIAAGATPQLSADLDLDRCQSRMLDAIHAMQRDPLRGVLVRAPDEAPRRRLQLEEESAYQLTSVA